MSLYDLLTGSETIRDVSLLWVRETYLKERVRLGGRVAELIYKGSVLDLSKSFVGPVKWAVEFSIFQDCWDGMRSTLTEEGGILSGYHVVRSPDLPADLDDIRDYNPRALYSMELVKVLSGGSTLWDAEGRINPPEGAGKGPAVAGGSPSGNVAGAQPIEGVIN